MTIEKNLIIDIVAGMIAGILAVCLDFLLMMAFGVSYIFNITWAISLIIVSIFALKKIARYLTVPLRFLNTLGHLLLMTIFGSLILGIYVTSFYTSSSNFTLTHVFSLVIFFARDGVIISLIIAFVYYFRWKTNIRS